MADSDDEWRFAVEDLPDDEETTGESADGEAVAATASDRGDASAAEGNVAGTLAADDEIEPGQPTLENAVFVALGVAVTVVLFLIMGGVI